MVNPKIELPRGIAATVTTNTTAPAGQHLPVDATVGNVTITLPAAVAGNAGAHLSIEKTDSTANTVTVTGSMRGATLSITLTTAREALEFRADATGSWWPQANHLPKSYVNAKIAEQAITDAATYATKQSAVLAYVDPSDSGVLVLLFTDLMATNFVNNLVGDLV